METNSGTWHALTLAEAARASGATEEQLRRAMVVGALRFRVSRVDGELAFVCTQDDLAAWVTQNEHHAPAAGASAQAHDPHIADLLDSAAADISSTDAALLRLSAGADQSSAALSDLLACLERWQDDPAVRDDLGSRVSAGLSRQAQVTRRSRLLLDVAQRRLAQAATHLATARHYLEGGDDALPRSEEM